MNIYSLDITI